eukprot:6677067-Pyramimonas_sp.AAC.1
MYPSSEERLAPLVQIQSPEHQAQLLGVVAGGEGPTAMSSQTSRQRLRLRTCRTPALRRPHVRPPTNSISHLRRRLPLGRPLIPCRTRSESSSR